MEGSRLSRIEAERIIAILDDATEKLGFLDSITPDLLQHRDELSKFIDNEISKTMTEQKLLEKRYEELIEIRATMKGMANKSKYKAVQEEIQAVSRSLRESTNNLVRNLTENPNISGNLIKVQRDRTELQDLISRCGQELRDGATYQTIVNRVNEESAARLRLFSLQAKEQESAVEVAELQERLTDEQRAFTMIQAQQKAAISHLKSELGVIKGNTSADSVFKRKEGLVHVSCIYRDFRLTERALESKLKGLQDKSHTELLVHNESKDFMLRKQTILSDSINAWQTKIDTEVGKKDEDIKDLTHRRMKLLEELCLLENRKNNHLIQNKKNEENDQIELKKVAEKKLLLKRQHRAARVIVREVRAHVKFKKLFEALKGI